MASNLAAASNGLQPTSDGPQPTSNRLQPSSNGLQHTRDGLQPTSDGLQPNSGGLQPISDGLPFSLVSSRGRTFLPLALAATASRARAPAEDFLVKTKTELVA